MRDILTRYTKQLMVSGSDIAAHLPLLRKYAAECTYITEMGVRGFGSTWAFLAVKPHQLTSIDWDRPPYEVCKTTLAEVEDLCAKNKIGFKFVKADTTDCYVHPTDLLFIDTWHNYEQLLLELVLHADQANKYIIAHDTNERVFPGMLCAIEDYLKADENWEFEFHTDEFPGLTVIKRVSHGCANKREISKKPLREEIARQREMYYEAVTADGAVGERWLAYREEQKAKFADAARWPFANQR